MDETDKKTVCVKGFNNFLKNQNKPLIENKNIPTKLYKQHNEKEPKKRVDSMKWTFSNEFFEHCNQLKLINEILQNNFKSNDEITKIIFQQINKKISGYKQQDIFKKRFDEDFFLNFESVIQKMVECELKCRYCNNEMFVLYDISRETKQWSVDRIDNDLGHNFNNFHLACLDCNLHRRRRTDEKFLFTKQLSIVKLDD